MKILCFGMVVCDYLIAEIPSDIMSRNGASIQSLRLSGGGDALNVAVGLTRLGQEAIICGRIAADPTGAYLTEYCKDNGVSPDYLIQDDEFPSATSFALIDPSGERHFLFENRIYANYSAEMVNERMIESADGVYFGSLLTFPKLDGGGLAEIFRRVKSAGKLTAMDAAIHGQKFEPGRMKSLRAVLEATDIFFPSIAEMEIYTGSRNPYKIAESVRDSGLKVFGIKLGEAGCYVTDFSDEKIIPAIPVQNVVDTTGAGDSFFAGFLSGWANGYTPFECAKIGNIVASYAIQKLGSTIGIPSFDRVVADLRASA